MMISPKNVKELISALYKNENKSCILTYNTSKKQMQEILTAHSSGLRGKVKQ
jgi:ribosomal protein S17E